MRTYFVINGPMHKLGVILDLLPGKGLDIGEIIHVATDMHTLQFVLTVKLLRATYVEDVQRAVSEMVDNAAVW